MPGALRRSTRAARSPEWAYTRDEQRQRPAAQHADGAAHQRERRRLDQELPQDGAARRAQRLAHPDLPRPLGDGDHHDRDHADATHIARTLTSSACTRSRRTVQWRRTAAGYVPHGSFVKSVPYFKG